MDYSIPGHTHCWICECPRAVSTGPTVSKVSGFVSSVDMVDSVTEGKKLLLDFFFEIVRVFSLTLSVFKVQYVDC